MNSEQREQLTGKIIEQITDAVNNGIDQIIDGLERSEDGKANCGISIKLTKTEDRVYVGTVLRGATKWDVEVPEDSVDISETLALGTIDEEARNFHRMMKKHGATVTIKNGGEE